MSPCARDRAQSRGGCNDVQIDLGEGAPAEGPARPAVHLQSDGESCGRLVHPGFPGDSVGRIPSSLVVWSSAASARSNWWAPVSERAVNPGSSTTGTTTRSRPLGERRPFRPLVPGRRRARLWRRRSGSSACGVVALPVARRREPRRSLPGAWPRGRSVLTPGIEVGPIEGERETAVERTPAEPGHLEEREDRLDRYLRGDLPADDPAPRGVEEREVASIPWCKSQRA